MQKTNSKFSEYNQPKRIAMWSGPRSLSTALMRAWGNRPDTAVWDEPLFPTYLLYTNEYFSYREEVLEKYESDWGKVMPEITSGPIPDGKAIYYQKYISRQLLPEQMGMEWLLKLTNCILIRDPRDMLISLYQKWPDMPIEYTGIPQLQQIFQYLRQTTGMIPPIIDARDLLQNPRRILSLLCEAVGVQFSEAMLSWPAGRRATDGVWAKEWYKSVEKSTGFQPYKPKESSVPEPLLSYVEPCYKIYHELYEYRLH